MRMECQAHAKINWALNITGRRADGYHELDMLMQSIALADLLTFELAESLTLTVDGAVPGDVASNLVMRAARALNARTGKEHGARITLTKRVPVRAGLGGGSADCATALKALNRLWALGLSPEELRGIGASLGADVPFCLAGGLARVSGIGERIEPVSGAPEIPLVLVTPDGGLSTAEVFRRWDCGGWPPVRLDCAALADAVARRDLPAVDALCANALAGPAIELMPEIDGLRARLRALGAGAVFMTGSGPTVVAAFANMDAARAAAAAVPGALLTHTLSEPGAP